MLYASLFQYGKPSMPTSITGCTPMQGIQLDDNLSGYISVTLQSSNAVPFWDCEKHIPPGLAMSFGTTTSKATIGSVLDFISRITEEGRAIKSLLQGRELGFYGPCPLGRDWPYDQTAATNAKRAKANQRFAKLAPYEPFSQLCIDAYDWIEDRAGMTQDAARNFTALKVANARIYKKPITVFIDTVYIGGGPGDRLTEAALLGGLEGSMGCNRCLWQQVANEDEAKDVVSWVRSVASRNGIPLDD